VQQCDVAIIGAGIVGIATGYYLKQLQPSLSVVLIESGQPMSLTSAQSGENYRNWWPHPVMTAFTDRSIDLMEVLSSEHHDAINMSRRGYVLATRSDSVDQLLAELHHGYSELEGSEIRVHDGPRSASYQKASESSWVAAPSGVDVLRDQSLIQQTFPSFDSNVKTVIHIRRAGAISGALMGQLMLDRFKALGGRIVTAEVAGIEVVNGFRLLDKHEKAIVHSAQMVNAAGPFLSRIAAMLGTELPVVNTLQQKIAFEDKQGAIPRDMPFSIDLDAQTIDWTEDERALLAESEDYDRFIQPMPGSIHSRPDGGDAGRWVKMGWAFNDTPSVSTRTPELTDSFPEIVLRGAARLNPALKSYYGQLPRSMHHYGGYYTMTTENWPLIGPTEIPGAFVVGALSGFGTMAACAAGDLCARGIVGAENQSFADDLSLNRYRNKNLMNELLTQASRGIL